MKIWWAWPTPRGTAAWRRAISAALVACGSRCIVGLLSAEATLCREPAGYHVQPRMSRGVLCRGRTLYMEALIRCGRAVTAHPMFALKPDAPTPLVSQIVDGLRRLIGDQSLKAGTKLPSIRAFAASHGVSVF